MLFSHRIIIREVTEEVRVSYGSCKFIIINILGGGNYQIPKGFVKTDRKDMAQ